MSDNKSPNSDVKATSKPSSQPVTNAEFKAALMVDGQKFQTCYGGDCCNRGYPFVVRKHEMFTPGMAPLYSIKCADPFGGIHAQSMNVNKFGPTCITLYTYDMLGNKTTGKLHYKCIMLVD